MNLHHCLRFASFFFYVRDQAILALLSNDIVHGLQIVVAVVKL